MKIKAIERLTPFLARKIWGSKTLTQLKGNRANENLVPVGESLEVSRLDSGSSLLQDGTKLNSFISLEEMPYLVKIIETTDNLSIQVHPDDLYAQKVEQSLGKSECWLILDSSKNSGIYLGFKKGIKKEAFKKAIENNNDASSYLNFYPVKEGDFFFVPAGTIHAIGKGIRLAEIQQSSGITYRVWDWNRLDSNGEGRELHIQKAFDVMNFEEALNGDETFQIKRDIFLEETYKKIFSHRDFEIDRYKLNSCDEEIIIKKKGQRYSSLLNLRGCLKVKSGNEETIVGQFESILFDCDLKKTISIESEEDACFLVIG